MRKVSVDQNIFVLKFSEFSNGSPLYLSWINEQDFNQIAVYFE